jgi:hypothetical protein
LGVFGSYAERPKLPDIGAELIRESMSRFHHGPDVLAGKGCRAGAG